MDIPNQTQRIRISDRGNFLYKWSIIFSAILALTISFMIMGTAFAHFFSGLLIIFSSFMLILHALIRLTNWFEFDDENKMIVTAFRHRIPYNKVQAIVINDNFKGINIYLKKTNWMPPYPIASVWSLAVAEVAEKEFKQRFPLNIIKRKTFSAKKRRILISVIAIALIIWLAYLLYFMYQTELIAVVTAEKKEWLAAKHSDTGAHYEIAGFDFTLPDRFAKVKEEKEWYYFEDNISKMKINVGPGLFHSATFKERFLFDFLMGISDDYDFFRLAYTARFGLIPTINNHQAFKELFDIKLYEISRGELHGIVLQGMKGSKSIAEIIIADKKHGIRLFLSQPGERSKISEELLKAIVESIQSRA